VNLKLKYALFLTFFFFVVNPVFPQSNDDFLNDFGGDSFSDLEAEIDTKTSEIIIETRETDSKILDKEINSSSFITGTLSQRLVYGLEDPGTYFSRSSQGVDNFQSKFNFQIESKILGSINFKTSGDVSWDWGSFKGTNYEYNPTAADFQLRDMYFDYFFDNGLWLKLGNQIIARGESNILTSSDVINPRDISTIGLQDLDDIRIQVPAILLNYSVGFLNQEIITAVDSAMNKFAKAGTAFDPMAPFGSASVVSKTSRPNNSIETVIRNKVSFNGMEFVLSFGEYNRKNLSTISTSVSGATTTLNSEQDRVSFVGFSGNMAKSNFVFKFDAAYKKGKRFPFSNPLTAPWSKHENTELGLGFDYTGISDLTISSEIGSSIIHGYSSLLSNKEREYGYLVRADWRQLNDILTFSAGHSKLLGDNGSFSTFGISYDYSDQLNLSSKLVAYDSDSASQRLYPYRKQDLLVFNADYSF